MFNHPYISNRIAQDRHREALASAEQWRLARQFRAQSRPGSRPTAQPAGDGQPTLRALRTAARLRLAARSAARRLQPAHEVSAPPRAPQTETPEPVPSGRALAASGSGAGRAAG